MVAKIKPAARSWPDASGTTGRIFGGGNPDASGHAALGAREMPGQQKSSPVRKRCRGYRLATAIQNIKPVPAPWGFYKAHSTFNAQHATMYAGQRIGNPRP